ncbi:SAM-dependent methyltransferase [Phytohabitans suffuscus]|uniref:Methyltransferase type 11 n=1 Tax=Phytohabitans suffuscus TaxID=624315 RepID=A0A6F8Y9G8_9ACTN|nr:methyltransferase domain-containing protein [Phytohabitans suffuscus]BCB82745.1 methyltransferase type 11 [Phytohabitans suffuscus]
MTSPVSVPTSDQVADYYALLGPLMRMAWGDNFHFGYWDGPDDRSTVQEASDRFTDLLVERLRVGPGDRVLDVGCGVGRPAMRLAATTGASVLGITVSAEQVEIATEQARVEGLSGRVSFQFADGMNTPFAADSFDAVLAFESINHMDRATALREMRRVVKPGGRIVLTDVTPPKGTPPPDDTNMVSSLVRFEDFPDLARDAGLVLEELTDVSAQTRPTIERLIDRILDTRKEFEAAHGVTVQSVLDGARAVLPTSPASFGCLIMVAAKP